MALTYTAGNKENVGSVNMKHVIVSGTGSFSTPGGVTHSASDLGFSKITGLAINAYTTAGFKYTIDAGGSSVTIKSTSTVTISSSILANLLVFGK
jgi:hypothetical protein